VIEVNADNRALVLLGPQKAESRVGRELHELGVRGRVALLTAGWQEREPDDAALVAELEKLGMSAVNLRLHARSEEVFRDDEELQAAYSARQERLRHVQSFYRLRLDYAGDAARAISVRHVDPELLEQESRVSVEQLRQLDRSHLERCAAVHAAFDERWRVRERKVVARHIRELRALLEPCEAVVISGGHVASLLNRMKLFDIAALTSRKHLVAWSAGAMALTERIVLFHDFPPFGSIIAQVLDAGLGLAPGLVALPDPRRRIRADDRAGIARFAQRMAPALCVAMDGGARLVFERGRMIAALAERLTPAGEVEREWKGASR
jgi:hypothetical protein